MLDINRNQVQIGQKIVVSKDLFTDGHSLESYSYGKLPTIPYGTVLTIQTKPDAYSALIVTDESGTKYRTWWSTLKSRTDLGQFQNVGSDVVEYKIYLDGVDIKKKKFKDMGKIKSSLMSMMDYHNKFQQIAKNYYDRCPENQEGIEYYYESYGDSILNRKQFHNIEIYEWTNRKKGNKVDFDPVAFYDELMKYIAVSAQFGSAARELYKKAKDTHSIIVVYVPEEYRNGKTVYYYHELTESDVIKEALKSSGVKGTTKSSKNGKTAIAFRDKSDAMKVIRLLPKDTFYILDMNGDELEEKTELFVLNQSRAEKLRKLMAEVEN